MPRGMANCRICGKSVPSFYRPFHEKKQCLRMRKLRGDFDVISRELPKVQPLKELENPDQTRLMSFHKINEVK